MSAAAGLVAYLPFLTPINVFHDWSYLLLVPLAFGISVIYKALRMQSLHGFWRHVTVMTTQIVVAMIALAVALTVFVIFVVPMLPVR